MSEHRHLDSLAQELSLGERQNLLQKLESQSVISKDPLYQEQQEDGQSGDTEARYAKLPWWKRLLFFIVGIFRGQNPVRLYQNQEIMRLGRALEQQVPTFYNSVRGILLLDFYSAVSRLRDASRFFYNALDAGFNRDRGGFFVFLGSLEMPGIHARLVEETDPENITEENPGMAESVIRQTAMHALEGIMEAMSEEERLKMYAHARSLVCLKQLSSFLYDRLLLAFSSDDASGGMVCSAGVIRDALISLNNVLYSLKEIPSMALLGSLFVFILQGREEKEDFDINTETQRLLKQAETAIAAIRAFNRQIPLVKIVRVAARDTSIVPQANAGGEDWFMVYREHWKQSVNDSLFRFFSQRRRRDLQKMYSDFFRDIPPVPLENAFSGENAEGVDFPGADTLGFLLTFALNIFLKELNPFLRIVMAEGEFSRPENRLEFDEAYNELIQMDEKIRKFDADLGPDGDWGKRHKQTNSDLSALPVKRRKIQLLMEECWEKSRSIIGRGSWALDVMAGIAGAFAAGGKNPHEPNAHFGTLINMDKLAAKTPALREGLVMVAQKLKRACDILAEVNLLEGNKPG